MLGTVGDSLNFYRSLQRYMLEHDAFEEVWENSDDDLRREMLELIDSQCTSGLRTLIDRQKPLELWTHKQLVAEAKKLRIKNYSRMNMSELREVLHEERGDAEGAGGTAPKVQ